MKEVKVNDISLSNESNFVLIAGVNVLEDEGVVNEVTEELKKVTNDLGIPFIFIDLNMFVLWADGPKGPMVGAAHSAK